MKFWRKPARIIRARIYGGGGGKGGGKFYGIRAYVYSCV